MTGKSPASQMKGDKPDFVDVTDDSIDQVAQLPPHGHNASSQHDVQPNADLALHFYREHEHRHLHHAHRASVELDKHHDLEYSTGTTFERSNIPTASPEDGHQHLHPQRYPAHEKDADGATADVEKGDGLAQVDTSNEEYPQRRSFALFYAKHRILFHLVVWLFFTGYGSCLVFRPCAPLPALLSTDAPLAAAGGSQA